MGYVIAGIIVLLVAAGAVTWLVMSATSRRGRGDDRTDIVAQDESPMGDTTQHAGEQSSAGHTVDDPESAGRGIDPGEDGPAPGGDAPARPERPEDRQLRDAGASTQPS